MTWIFLSQRRTTCALLLQSSPLQRECGWILSWHTLNKFRRPTTTSPLARLFTSSSTTTTSTPEHPSSAVTTNNDDESGETATTLLKNIRVFSPWNNNLSHDEKKEKVVENRKFRQHVNPLALRYQQPTILSPQWPNDVYRDTSLPLILDIGCGKGGFLLDLAQHYAKTGDSCINTNNNNNLDNIVTLDQQPLHPQHPFNYLGLEIRPAVARYAQSRIDTYGLTGRLDFVGCNVNVDLERLLQLYHGASTRTASDHHINNNSNDNCGDNNSTNLLSLVTIQFPDPHFKSHHVKRRVVTSQLVQTICRYMPPHARVFLQSDVKTVLDDMRLQFRVYGSVYLEDMNPVLDHYLETNILGVSTERERSVLKRNLPIYRAVFQRTSAVVVSSSQPEPSSTKLVPTSELTN